MIGAAGCAGSGLTVPEGIETTIPSPPPAGRTHRVAKGETLWRIAASYGVPVEELAAYNKIPDAAVVEEGQLLRIPGSAAPPPAEVDDAFVWPARGRVVHGFGSSLRGGRSPGLEILLPPGEVVRAVHAGRVVFADDLPGYRRTVIIEHRDGLMSIYARTDGLRVTLGETVTRGEVVAETGPTKEGTILLFQMRKGGRPVNPLFYLPQGAVHR